MQRCHFLFLQADSRSCLIFQLKLHLFYLEDAFGVDSLYLTFHQLVQQNILGWYALFEEIFKVFLVLFDVVILLNGRCAL